MCGHYKIIVYFLFAALLPCPASAVKSMYRDISAEISPVAQAVQHFNEHFFKHRTSALSVIAEYESLEARYFFDDLLLDVLKPLDGLKLRIQNRGVYNSRELEYYNIIMVESYAGFSKINPGSASQTQDFSEYYLIILYKNFANYMQDMEQIFDYCWSYYIMNVDIIIAAPDVQTVELFTYYPFSETHCRRMQIKRLNVDTPVQQLSPQELYPPKAENFYGCTLVAALWNVPPYLMLPTKMKPLLFDGMEGYLLYILSRVMNFTIGYIVPPNNEQRGLILKNGTLTGALKILQEKRADMSLGSFRRTLERSTTLTPSVSFYQTFQVFTVLAAREPWGTYEILTYPFDYYVWTILMCLLLALITSALVLDCVHFTVMRFIYGFASYSHIIINWLASILGQPTHITPTRNFARLVFTMWLLLTLVLRSCYQGLLYDYLKVQQSVDPPDTTQDLSQRQYKLLVNVATRDSFSGLPLVRDKLLEVVVLNITDAGGFPILEQNAAERYVTGTPRDFLTHYVNMHRKYGVFHVLHETIFSQQLCIFFTKHSYLKDSVNTILFNLRSFGMIDYWASQYFDVRFLEISPEKERRSDAVVLSMLQLHGIFEIQYFLWLLACAVFVGEILLHHLVKFFRKLKF